MRIALSSTCLRLCTGIVVVVSVWGLLGPVFGQPRPDVTLWVEGDSVTAGEPFILNIEGSTPAHRGIAFPSADADSVFGALEVLSRSRMYTRKVGGGYAIDSVAYTMRTSARDSVVLPPVPIRVDVVAGTLTTHTEPRTLRVRAGPGRGMVFQEMLGSGVPERTWWWILAALAAGALCGGVYMWGRGSVAPLFAAASGGNDENGSSEEGVAPYEAARRQLDDLDEYDRAAPEEVEAFYVELADIVRTYLAQRADIATAERTTGEVVDALTQRVDVPPEGVEALRQGLEKADRVKFAAVRPEASAARQDRETVRSGLNAIESAIAEAPASATRSSGSTSSVR